MIVDSPGRIAPQRGLNILPPLGQRGVITGRTGSGKTELAIAMLEGALHSYDCVILDTKGVRAFEKLPGFLYEDPGHLLDSFDPAIVEDEGYRPFARIYRPIREDNEARNLDAFLDELFDLRRSMYIYIDEVAQIVESNTKPARGLANLLQRGRYREAYGQEAPIEVSVICSTQRPVFVPKIVFTESEHFYAYALTDNDLRLVALYAAEPQIADIPPNSVPLGDPLRRYNFYYANVQTQELRLCRINLGDEG